MRARLPALLLRVPTKVPAGRPRARIFVGRFFQFVRGRSCVSGETDGARARIQM